jgi:tRNA U55 pseudouridine synthase TruB
LPLAAAVAHLPTMRVATEEIARIKHGQAISREDVATEEECAALDETGQLVAILGRRAPGEWSPVKNFAT